MFWRGKQSSAEGEATGGDKRPSMAVFQALVQQKSSRTFRCLLPPGPAGLSPLLPCPSQLHQPILTHLWSQDGTEPGWRHPRLRGTTGGFSGRPSPGHTRGGSSSPISGRRRPRQAAGRAVRTELQAAEPANAGLAWPVSPELTRPRSHRWPVTTPEQLPGQWDRPERSSGTSPALE